MGYTWIDMAAAQRFDSSGGALCLDFVNTLADRPRCQQEHLQGFDDLLAFSRQAGTVSNQQARALAAEAEAHPGTARRGLARAKRLREHLFAIFAALAAERPPPEESLEALNRALAEAGRHMRLVAADKGFRLGWIEATLRRDSVLWPVVRSAAELLLSEERNRLRQCHSDCCSWLFLDRSRTKKRRWCDMSTCGNRAKAKRHYWRSRQPQAR